MAILDTLTGPEDLRHLPPERLPGLAGEIRALLIDTVPRTGGHLGPNLGVVELTIALHRVFQSPRDAIVWDTGHQSYVHKLLTGRRHNFDRLRTAGGLSGYPCRAESAHDWVENSHASTALSYADGLAKAFALTGGPDRAVVAVVGDGALTGGMCWEALNNIAAADRPVIVVVNDNGRSYSPTVGAFAAALAAAPGTSVFRQLGMVHLGPVDGHDITAVEDALRAARACQAPVVVHCRTRKGNGYPPAERDDTDHLHTVAAQPAHPPPAGEPAGPAWTQVFSDELIAIAADRSDVVATTAAMLYPTGLADFARKYPERVFDVGIAEQHALTCSAGLAMGGLHPLVCVYATFLNRAFDQTLMDVALHQLPVTLVLDRAGITGPDGPSHHGIWDLSLLGVVPGMRVAAPRDAPRLRALLRAAVDHHGPSAIRFPKGTTPPQLATLDRLGHGALLRAGTRDEVLIVAVGPCAGAAVSAAEQLAARGIEVDVVDPEWVYPVDPAIVASAAEHRLALTVEDASEAGGFGDAFTRAARAAGIDVPIRSLGLPRRFLPHASRSALLADAGLNAPGIVAAVIRHCRNVL